MQRNAKILISGAGIAGLTAAIWLGRHGFRPVVVEKAPEIRADGFIISLSHHAYRFAVELGLMPHLRSAQAGIAASSYHDRTGRALLTLDYARLFEGVDIIQIMRDDLESILYEQARDLAEFRFATTATSLEQEPGKVHVGFNHGEPDSYDLVIGADGLHSAVRGLAFEGEVRRRHLGLYSAAFRLENLIDLRQKFETHMERSRYMVVFTTRQNDLGTVFVWASDLPRPPPQAERWAHLRATYAGAPAMISRVLEGHRAGTDIYMDSLIQIEMRRWHKGRVVLLGDAAHCITLLSGQGASAAFSGASRLAKALIESEPEAAFADYQGALHPLVNTLQPLTRRAAKWYVPRTRFNHFARNSALRWLPNRYFQSYFKTKYSRG